MINGSFRKVVGILNENRSVNKIIKDCFFTNKNKQIYSFSNNLFKTNVYNFCSTSTSNEGKKTIELIKILRAETSKKINYN
jgi:hypothetical protein